VVKKSNKEKNTNSDKKEIKHDNKNTSQEETELLSKKRQITIPQATKVCQENQYNMVDNHTYLLISIYNVEYIYYIISDRGKNTKHKLETLTQFNSFQEFADKLVFPQVKIVRDKEKEKEKNRKREVRLEKFILKKKLKRQRRKERKLLDKASSVATQVSTVVEKNKSSVATEVASSSEAT